MWLTAPSITGAISDQASQKRSSCGQLVSSDFERETLSFLFMLLDGTSNRQGKMNMQLQAIVQFLSHPFDAFKS